LRQSIGLETGSQILHRFYDECSRPMACPHCH
jgi:hypothetical protein